MSHISTTALKQSTADDLHRPPAKIFHKYLISGLAALLTLLVVLTESSSTATSYRSLANVDYPDDAFALISQSFNFTESRRLNSDSGTQLDPDQNVATHSHAPNARINTDTSIVDCQNVFDQRQRHFCNSLNPRAPPLLS